MLASAVSAVSVCRVHYDPTVFPGVHLMHADWSSWVFKTGHVSIYGLATADTAIRVLHELQPYFLDAMADPPKKVTRASYRLEFNHYTLNLGFR